MNRQLVDQINSMGFPSGRADLIHAFVGGSSLHGVKLPGRDDLDLYGIFIERPLYVCGLDHFEHFVTSTATQSSRNGPDDVDVTCYSLRKWASLALKGNPTVLQFLFTPALTGDVSWSAVLGFRGSFLAVTHGHQYMGYADAQLRRMKGERGTGKHGQRDELVARHGYDTKSAMHALRILLDGIELMRTGWITLPRPEGERDWLLSVRRGEHTMDWVLTEANRLFAAIKEAMAHSVLPESVNRESVSVWITQQYLDFWTCNVAPGGGR